MACSAEQKHKNKLSQTLANTLATVTKEQNWSKHLEKFSVIARQNKARGKNSIQLVTQATHKKRVSRERTGTMWDFNSCQLGGNFSYFPLCEGFIWLNGCFSKGKQPSWNQNRRVKTRCFGFSKDYDTSHLTANLSPSSRLHKGHADLILWLNKDTRADSYRQDDQSNHITL